MTAEVALLNRSAVALAADSAVTTNSGNGGGPKIWNTVNKLFALSKSQPVGVMIYSSAEILGVPAELAIKEYRREHQGQSHSTLEGYKDHFVNWLKTDAKIFSQESRASHCNALVWHYFADLNREILDYVGQKFPKFGEPTESQAKDIAKEILEARLAKIKCTASLSSPSGFTAELLLCCTLAIDSWKSHFNRHFAFGLKELKILDDLAIAICTHELPSEIETGIVFAGYGTDELFPQLRSIEVEFSLNLVHKLRDVECVDAVLHGPQIVPFAQTHMIESFMRGRPKWLDERIKAWFSGCFENEKTRVQNSGAQPKDVKNLISAIDSIHNQFLAEFTGKMDQFTDKHLVEPLNMAVGSMPKEELAIVAEALIQLTAIRSRTTEDETVGGPVDVAVISKGDGFVWIKRKHYFEASMNPAFIQTYMEGRK